MLKEIYEKYMNIYYLKNIYFYILLFINKILIYYFYFLGILLLFGFDKLLIY